jgi:hypothetical protein
MSEIANVAGVASVEVKSQASAAWAASALAAGVEIAVFDPSHPLGERLKSAKTAGLAVATICVRSSIDLQEALADEVIDLAEYAGRNGMYVPPEYVVVDVGPGVGRRSEMDQVKSPVPSEAAEVILVFSLSRLGRSQAEISKILNRENGSPVVVSIQEGGRLHCA